MAITKMIVAGSHLRPALKRELKRQGYYAAALLALWKAALPYDEPYGSELRQRIAYNALGDRSKLPGYGFAGSERGDAARWFHRYDDGEHMQRLLALARSLEQAPPLALLADVEVEGGQLSYALSTAAVVVQQANDTVKVKVSTRAAFDPANRPLSLSWRLLYGERRTTVSRTGDSSWEIVVPWDDRLPEGRTAIALLAEAGGVYGNPAVISVFRQRQQVALPGTTGADNYDYTTPFANQRPLVLDAQDLAVRRPGKAVSAQLLAVDPEGFPVRWYLGGQRAAPLRSGLELDGNVVSWTPPRQLEAGTHELSLVASDLCCGNGYGGALLEVHVAPPVFARITADRLIGAAPLKVAFSAPESFVASGRMVLGWSLDGAPLPKSGVAGLKVATRLQHTFAQPGRHTVWLRAINDKGLQHDTSVTVFVTAPTAEPAADVSAFELLGNATLLSSTTTASDYHGTHAGTIATSDRKAHGTIRLLVVARGRRELEWAARALTIEGDQASDFKVTRAPRSSLAPGESCWIEVSFAPGAVGARTATLVLTAKDGTQLRVPVAGEGR
jgi:hypothetical protein